MIFSPVLASKEITDKYRRYLSTIFALDDADYQQQFQKTLQSMPFANGPLLDVTDAFETGETIRQLIASAELPNSFLRLHFPADRPLYRHQVTALRKVNSGGNLVVSTGTGSGKTESFLLPIMRSLVSEYEQGTLDPGIRAMLIYPMNALANDQVERLRELLADFPEITFGSYTGQTKETYTQALADYKMLNDGQKPLKNELISREQMKETPPHILITNYAMLEYLMVRPRDSVFFSKRYTRNWKYIVLDEAHVYKGSTGIEVAMLLRRLKARLEKENLQYILTSATLGGEHDNDKVAVFAQNLCNGSFAAEDVVRAARIVPRKPAVCQSPPPGFYRQIAELINQEAEDSKICRAIADMTGIMGEDEESALYQVIRKDPFYWELRSQLQTPQTVQALLAACQITEQELTDFVTVATRAVKDGGKLFDVRYHMFLRAADNVFITLPPNKRLFLEPKKTHIENGMQYKVFEIATCTHCHGIYILGRESEEHILEQASFSSDEVPRCAYLLKDKISDTNDECTLDDAGETAEAYELCPVCGSIYHKGQKPHCQHDRSIFVTVYKVSLRDGTHTLTKCPCCENVSSTGILRQFFTGQEAVTSVIGTSLFEALPSYTVTHVQNQPSEDDFDDGFDDDFESDSKTIQQAVGAKQFIAFSDSRQAAAFYTTYLNQTYTNIVYKRLVIETLKRPEYAYGGKMLNAFVGDLMGQFEKYGMADKLSSRTEAWKAALREVMTNNAVTSLYNLGLIQFDVDVAGGANNKMALTAEEVHEICALFADWMMSESAVSYPETLNAEQRAFFTPNGVEYAYTLSDANPRTYTKSFLPSRADLSNKRVNYLCRVLEKKLGVCEIETAKRFLESIWNRFFTSSQKGILDQRGGKYQLRSDKILVRRPGQLYVCKKCRRITPHNVAGVCPAYQCSGELTEFDPETEFANNHYYHLYRNLEIRPLRVVEHTAQLDKETAYDYQKKFKQKEIDILSCSTTFEMGVDVGSLETVFMRNMPPSPSNYAQRAGRAGRSKQSAAYALTFCNKSNHDFTFFRAPERMIKGKIEPPVFNVNNPKIAIRHVFASVFGFFWKEHQDYFDKIGDFISTDENGTSGVDKFRDFLAQKPAVVKDYLDAFLPAPLRREFEVDTFAWVDRLLNDKDGILTKAIDIYMDDVSVLEKARDDAFAAGGSGVDMLTQRIAVYKRESSLSFLARKNVFPKYGFPVDTVEMTIVDRKGGQRVGLQLQRDLSMAISEYAPGSQIVANGNLITSSYIRKMPNRSWKMSRYCTCRRCGDLNLKPYLGDEEQVSYATCNVCGELLSNADAGVYLIPEWGFQADGETIRKPGLRKPERTFRSEAAYVGSGKEIQEKLVTIGNAELFVRTGSAEEMAVLNRSRFYVCEQCGYAFHNEKAFGRYQKKKHKKASGHFCGNQMLRNYALAYRFETDILELQFRNPQVDSYDQALSLLYGILLGLSKSLSIEAKDVSGCLKWFRNPDTGLPGYGFVLYDSTPGGAGHVKRLMDETVLQSVLTETLQSVSSCTCGGEAMDTSCYSCLRNYYNQKHHELLQRKYVVAFLKTAIR